MLMWRLFTTSWLREKFVAEGYGVERKEVMYNDFVLIGPKADPAKVAGNDIMLGLCAALRQWMRRAVRLFVSRGDKSGTHAAELRYWRAAGVDLDRAKGPWYRDTGFRHGAVAQYGVVNERLYSG